MKRPAKIALGVVVVLVAMQLVRFERTNPPVTGEIDAPADVKAVLRRACYDCHSNETVCALVQPGRARVVADRA